MGIIYKATRPNGKCYVGQTIESLETRKRNHKSSSKIHGFKFANAIKKYGIDGFNWEVICEGILEKHLDEYEIWYIDFYCSYRVGYNCNEGGGGQRGFKHSDATKEKIRKTKIGTKHTNYIRKIPVINWGEHSVDAKLNWQKVKEIRSKYIPYKYSSRKLAKEYGVSHRAIQKVIKEETWRLEHKPVEN